MNLKFTCKRENENEEYDQPRLSRIAILRQKLIQELQSAGDLSVRLPKLSHDIRVLGQKALLRNVPAASAQFHQYLAPSHRESLHLILQALRSQRFFARNELRPSRPKRRRRVSDWLPGVSYRRVLHQTRQLVPPRVQSAHFRHFAEKKVFQLRTPKHSTLSDFNRAELYRERDAFA